MRDGSGRAIGTPSCAIVPCRAASRPATSRSSVDFPQPLGPSSATNSPASTDSVTSSSTGSAPPAVSNAWLTRRTSMRAPRGASAAGADEAETGDSSAALTI
ncbi:hypothetical protein BGV48_27445 [Burkholderia ubonensis]|nr:hypothetical protein BGV48_27445 [Burkholderia ubonensis]